VPALCPLDRINRKKSDGINRLLLNVDGIENVLGHVAT
jgi:hypothetical protein